MACEVKMECKRCERSVLVCVMSVGSDTEFTEEELLEMGWHLWFEGSCVPECYILGDTGEVAVERCEEPGDDLAAGTCVSIRGCVAAPHCEVDE